MNKDTLSIIFSNLPYKCLYDTIKVDHLWQKVSESQLKIRHQTNPILPILHNRLIKDQFIQSLRDIFLNYIKRKSIKFRQFLRNMGDLHTYGHNDDKFISIFNEDNNGAYTKLTFNTLYDYVMKTIKSVSYDSNRSKSSHHINRFYLESTLFEKTFVIFMYLRKILTIVHDRKHYSDDHYEYISWQVDIDYNRVFYYDLPSTKM